MYVCYFLYSFIHSCIAGIHFLTLLYLPSVLRTKANHIGLLVPMWQNSTAWVLKPQKWLSHSSGGQRTPAQLDQGLPSCPHFNLITSLKAVSPNASHSEVLGVRASPCRVGETQFNLQHQPFKHAMQGHLSSAPHICCLGFHHGLSPWCLPCSVSGEREWASPDTDQNSQMQGPWGALFLSIPRRGQFGFEWTWTHHGAVPQARDASPFCWLGTNTLESSTMQFELPVLTF